ncbi:MAG: hypothetical protein Q7T55_19115 [Solirubrobacteraceae bacterium]|nr:hypothetical protein [Solirubrobacteraceae bacterium]
MFVPSTTIAPLSLRKSAASVRLTSRGCDLRVPYSGTLTPQTRSALTSTLRRLMIQMRYGTRLKGLTVSTDDSILTVSAVASTYAVQKWLDSGEFIDAVETAVLQARDSVRR